MIGYFHIYFASLKTMEKLYRIEELTTEGWTLMSNRDCKLTRALCDTRLSEYVEECKSGYIIDSDNIHDLDQKIVHFFRSNDLNDMPKYIQSNKDKFSWEYHIQGLLELANES